VADPLVGPLHPRSRAKRLSVVPPFEECPRIEQRRGGAPGEAEPQRIGDITDTGNEEQVAQEAWDETGSNDKNSKGKEPKSPKDLRDHKSLAVQTEK
jgi:hypothetical protein